MDMIGSCPSPPPPHHTRRLALLTAALALDVLVGEPPAALHPVVWMGQLIGVLQRHAPRGTPHRELLYGAAMTGGCVVVAVAPALLLERAPIAHSTRQGSAATHLLHFAAGAALLKSTFAWKTLLQAGERVGVALQQHDLAAARAGLRWLVSRDAARLDASQVAAAAIESLAENASDSVVAPLLAYALFGLPGACGYRAVNTLDAMIGYRGAYEFLGKVPARLDDLLNIVPARLTGMLIVVAGVPCGADTRQAWRTMWRDHACTASPNAGYPMSAIAGALGITLEKVNHYHLNPAGRAPTPDDLPRAARLVTVALLLAVLIAGAATHLLTHR